MIRMIFILLALFSISAQAVTLEALQQRFASQPIVRADFSQMRTIKGMAQPLKSSGQLLIVQDKGLWWQQTQPFPLTLVLDEKRMVQVIGGQPAEIITADSNPQMFQFNHLLRALFQADRRVLEQNFALDFTNAGQQRWRLVLTPVTSPLDKLFNTITLEGAEYLDAIRLNDRQGDRTDITFSHQRLTPLRLSEEEQQRFVF
ncbi:outer membrane lipoprotein carrier protein LolA [Erwinia piriflorinigrans]|uniref:Outer-membrane lipoprotein carrier protein n=1 Tax=Erwinia piriflorinigrans CFBP 5888 TaxID=1161919 RepID=V5Z7I9_9GAMM|nr:outer membrane lipoprotein carrier protein LolA [Erwinia piriflorinigrans]CCG86907.1 Outer-membrane lipoprotein carrier protein [Erwinia piriflorinigrans CFBP 5888]